MMRRMELWVVIGLLAAAIPVQAQQDDNKKQPSDANAQQRKPRRKSRQRMTPIT